MANNEEISNMLLKYLKKWQWSWSKKAINSDSTGLVYVKGLGYRRKGGENDKKKFNKEN